MPYICSLLLSSGEVAIYLGLKYSDVIFKCETHLLSFRIKIRVERRIVNVHPRHAIGTLDSDDHSRKTFSFNNVFRRCDLNRSQSKNKKKCSCIWQWKKSGMASSLGQLFNIQGRQINHHIFCFDVFYELVCHSHLEWKVVKWAKREFKSWPWPAFAHNQLRWICI